MATRNLIGKFEPCPFCGKDDRLSLMPRETFEDLCASHGSAIMRITCERCHVEMHDFTFDEPDFYKRVDLLVQKWNGRCGEVNDIG